MNAEIPNNDSNSKEAYEARRAVRMEKKEAVSRQAGQKRTMKNIIIYAAILIALALVAYWGFNYVRNLAPQSRDFSRAIPVMEASHIPEGSPLAEYNSDPPSSGPHYAKTARPGFREESVDDRHLIHNLEHGDIWIAFHPRISNEAKEKLKDFGAGKVVIVPREANEFDIALVGWGRLDTFNIEGGSFDTRRIQDFITRYINQGPEKGVPPDHQGA